MDRNTITRISPYIRRRIISLKDNGMNNVQIREAINRENNVLVSRQGISEFLKRYRASGSVVDRTERNRRDPRTKLTDEHLNYIDNAVSEDRERSAAELSRLIRDRFGVTVSDSSIKRARQKLGWKRKSVKYCQQVRIVNRPKRLEFAINCANTNEHFHDVIFTDETTVKIQNSTNFTFWKDGEEITPRPKPKHPYQVHVWAGISRRGPTGIHIFTGIMDSTYYQSILQSTLLPFVHDVYPDGHRLMQDNDPKHVSRSTRQWMEDNGVNHWVTPPESPDMNPIENMWAALKFHIRRRVKPRSQEDLINGILEFWNSVTVDMCNAYINHLYKVIPKVIECDGNASGH